MKKKPVRFVEGISYLASPGTLAELRAISYYRGHRGKLAKAARELHLLGMQVFLASLAPAERKRFNEIMESVRLAEGLKGDVVVESTPLV